MINFIDVLFDRTVSQTHLILLHEVGNLNITTFLRYLQHRDAIFWKNW